MTGVTQAERAKRLDGAFSTRDPRRAGIKAAILARLHDRLKLAAEFSEPGHQNWRKEAGKLELLRELIAEIEELEMEDGAVLMLNKVRKALAESGRDHLMAPDEAVTSMYGEIERLKAQVHE